MECPKSRKLIQERNFPALKQLQKELSCSGGDGLSFDGRMPTVCCPSVTPKIFEQPKITDDDPVKVFQDELDKVCSQLAKRIRFGQGTGDHEYPWMAALVYETPEKDSEFIGC